MKWKTHGRTVVTVLHPVGKVVVSFNSLSNGKILDWSKFKAHADNKIHMTQNLNFVLGRAENILGKGENAGYQHFLLFSKGFLKASSSKVVKSRDYVVKG